MSIRPKSLGALCVLAGAWACFAPFCEGAGESAPTKATAPRLRDHSVPTAESTRGVITIAEVERRQSELDDLEDLTPEVRKEIAEHYATAIERLQAAAEFATQFEALEAEAARAPEEITRLEELTAAPPVARPEVGSTPEDIEKLRAAHVDAEGAAADRRKRLTAITAEIERRTARLGALSEAITDIRSRLESIAESLAATPTSGEIPEVTAARRLRLEAARQHRLAELATLEQEGRTYAATDRALVLERELAERVANESSKHLAAIARAVADHEEREAEGRAAAARVVAVMAHPAVREAAGTNTLLAEKLAALVESGKETRLELERTESLRGELGQQYGETRKRAEEAKFSPAIGLLLRSQQADLPDTSGYRQRASERENRQADINLELLQWETERRRLQNPDDAVAGYLDGIRTDLAITEQLDVREELAEVFRTRLSLYADLVTQARSMLGRLASLQSADDGLVQVVEEQRTFVAEHVLWVRSTAPFSLAVLPLVFNSLRDLVDPSAWMKVASLLGTDAVTQPLITLLLAPLLWLIVLRHRLSAKLEALAHDAQRSTATGFRPTLEAIAVSAALALPMPGVMFFVGWRLVAIGPGSGLAHAIGTAVTAGAAALAAMNLGIATCLPKGLGVAHFGWDREATASLRRALDAARVTALPAAIVVLFTEATRDELVIGTLGRMALVAQCACLTVITQRFFRRSGPVQAMMTQHHPGAWYRLFDRAWTRMLVILPIVLAGFSLAGYHYTAVRLSWRLCAMWGVIGAGVALGSFAMRWLAVVHRRLTLRRARERRAEMTARQESLQDSAAELLVTDNRSLELRLSDIEEQSRRLVQMALIGTGCVCLAMIWHDIVPAVGYLSRFTLWQSGIVSGGEAGEMARITLVEAILAMIVATVTVLACRNLPGLLDLAVFQRLPLDAGARYAATAMTQYVVAAVGVVLCFRQVGIGWQSVQWLVAAMTVGLGFGLQEIFANFVSGLILLFERPIRVGDVVTIGDVTGTVTRIRIRATTVCDWDNKELIVPNREFVTGKLVNWTLTNPTLRVVIRVGIAYGSDTRLASRLLEEIAKTQELVLADPPPTVVFTQFGESSLDFELRVFTTGIINTRVLRHELHLAIDDAFRANGIDIAFPQRELHVKGLPAHWHELAGEVSSAPPGTSSVGGTKRHVA